MDDRLGQSGWDELKAAAVEVMGRAYAPYSRYPAGEVIMPCGRCRQLLFEHGGRDLLVWTVAGVKPMSEVLPDAFGPDDLAMVASQEGTP